ncbi:hypothetical protein ACFVZ3_06290 [Kitasatospora purpeofusca]|uniref:hypothetical protein n=1 Tax=Kitasatospora purpeofusca TaxID=67352 RepID=UPI00368BC8EC
MTTTTATSTEELVRLTVQQLADGMRHVATANTFVSAAARGKLTSLGIEAVVRLESATLTNVTACLDLAAARFGTGEGAGFMREMARLVAVDLAGIRAAEHDLGITPELHPGHQLPSVAYGYPGFINWLCLHADPAAIALVAHTDLLLWHDACALLTPALRAHGGLPTSVVDYFASYEQRPDEALELAVDLAVRAVDGGADLHRATDVARLMEGHLAAFWRTLDH